MSRVGRAGLVCLLLLSCGVVGVAQKAGASTPRRSDRVSLRPPNMARSDPQRSAGRVNPADSRSVAGDPCEIASSDTPTTTNCWSGYVEQGSNYSSVSASWTVPSVTEESDSIRYDASTWVGIGGWGNDSLIQAGTSEELYQGALYYYVWDENLPGQPVEQYRFAVNPGDRITATVSESSGSTWQVSVVDDTSCAVGGCLVDNQTETYAGSTASAEFIQEAPSSSGDVLPLAAYQQFAFYNAEVNGGAANLTSSEEVTIPGLSTPSDPNLAGNAFEMEYGGSTPAPPAVPDAPMIGQAAAGNSSASVGFDSPGNDGGIPITSYTASCDSVDGGADRSMSGVGSPILVSGLTNGSTYACAVIAMNALGSSPLSTVSNIVIPGGVPDPPQAVSVRSGTTRTGLGTLMVRYAAGANNGAAITRFRATCRSNDGGLVRTGAYDGLLDLPITVTLVQTKKTYRCTVAATNSHGTSLQSIASPAVIVGAPNRPETPLVSRIGPGHLKVQFVDPPANGAPITTLKAVCRSPNGGVTRGKTGSASPLGVKSLTRGKTYECTIQATNARGAGPQSNPSAEHAA